MQERRLYDLIWKRTVASQMAESEIEKTVVTIDIDGQEEKFIADGEVVTFDGFLKVYHESTDDENQDNEGGNTLPVLNAGDLLERKTITSTEKYSQGPVRYTEASLVKKLEELGIGRPSTYAPTISTIQQREYVVKGDKAGEERQYVTDNATDKDEDLLTTLEVAYEYYIRGFEFLPISIYDSHATKFIIKDGKLLPTDIGTVVNDFLMEHFPEIMDYNFTAKVESQFDQIAEGHEEWTSMMHNFDHDFEPTVRKVMNARSEHKAGERELGVDPLSHRPVFVKIGRFGPVVQIGSADDEVKPRFAQLPSGKSIETITLDEALELFRLPRNIGEYEGDIVTIGSGRFGPYVQHDGKYVSLPKEMDPMTVTLADAIKLIAEKREQERQRHIKSFEEDSTMQVLNGRFGPYITCDGKNYRLPKSLHERAAQLTYAECKEIVDKAPEPKARRKK